MFRYISKLFLAFVLLMLCNLPGHGQVARRMLTIEGDAFRIPELSAIISEEEDKVKVVMAMPTEMRRKAYRNVDLQESDIVLYLNGKRIKAVKDFEETYESLAIGDTVQIGIRRDEDRFIVSFPKADPKDLPQMGVVRRGSGEEGGEAEGGRIVIRRGPGEAGEAENLTPVLSLGVLIGLADEAVKVVDVLPIPDVENVGLQKGDVIKKLNGQEIEKVAQFEEQFEKIGVGEQVNLEFLRDGKEMKISFPKPESPGNVMIRTGKH